MSLHSQFAFAVEKKLIRGWTKLKRLELQY